VLHNFADAAADEHARAAVSLSVDHRSRAQLDPVVATGRRRRRVGFVERTQGARRRHRGHAQVRKLRSLVGSKLTVLKEFS
jgi:hypothetical protein